MTLGFAALGIAPDLDLIVGAHRGPTHSAGAVVLVALATWFVVGRQARRGRWTIACAAAYGSHLLLDWLAKDSVLPVCGSGGRFLRELRACYTKDGSSRSCSSEAIAYSQKSCGQASFLMKNVK